MPTYEFRCRGCAAQIEASQTEPAPCPECGGELKRVFGFNIGASFNEHYNNSVNRYVPNRTALRSAFSEASDSASAYTGIEHKFVERDPMDHAAFGLSDADVAQVKDDAARMRHGNG